MSQEIIKALAETNAEPIAVVAMTKVRETKNAIRYELDGNPHPATPYLKSFYITKEQGGSNPPERLLVIAVPG